MTDDAARVRRLLAPLRDRPVSVDAERLAARRELVVSVLERQSAALALARAARPRRRAAYALLALAAGISLLLGARLLAQRGTLRAGSQRAAVPAPLTFVGGIAATMSNHDFTTAEHGSAELSSATGLGLRLGENTRISVAELVGAGSKNQVLLTQGLLSCTVPHLTEGQRFAVVTPDARVVVHGTVFSVQVDTLRAPGSQTCVAVTDGVVIVQHGDSETALNAGESWGCAPDPESTAARPALLEAPKATKPPASRSGSRAPEHGTLTEETALFQAALASERLGDRTQAQAQLSRLLSRYPSSPLAPEARNALSRIASGSGSATP